MFEFVWYNRCGLISLYLEIYLRNTLLLVSVECNLLSGSAFWRFTGSTLDGNAGYCSDIKY